MSLHYFFELLYFVYAFNISTSLLFPVHHICCATTILDFGMLQYFLLLHIPLSLYISPSASYYAHFISVIKCHISFKTTWSRRLYFLCLKNQTVACLTNIRNTHNYTHNFSLMYNNRTSQIFTSFIISKFPFKINNDHIIN